MPGHEVRQGQAGRQAWPWPKWSLWIPVRASERSSAWCLTEERAAGGLGCPGNSVGHSARIHTCGSCPRKATTPPLPQPSRWRRGLQSLAGGDRLAMTPQVPLARPGAREEAEARASQQDRTRVSTYVSTVVAKARLSPRGC